MNFSYWFSGFTFTYASKEPLRIHCVNRDEPLRVNGTADLYTHSYVTQTLNAGFWLGVASAVSTTVVAWLIVKK